VINDGSTDASDQAVKPFLDRIRYVKQDNAGPSVARNHGIELARGQYIAFLDADDDWLPEKLSAQVKFMDEHPDVMWCTTNAWLLRGDSTEPSRTLFAQDAGDSGQTILDDWFLRSMRGNVTATPGVMARSELFGIVGVFDPDIPAGQDMDMWIRIARVYPRLGLLSRPLMRIRYHLPGCVSLGGKKKYLSMLVYLQRCVRQSNESSESSGSFKLYLQSELMNYARTLLPMGFPDISREYLRSIPPEWRNCKWRLLMIASWVPSVLFRCLLRIRLLLARR